MPQDLADLELVVPHRSVEQQFRACKNIYVFRFVKRASRATRNNGKDRVLVVGAQQILLFDPSGVLKKEVNIREIERVFVQERKGGARFVLVGDGFYPLIFDSVFLVKNRDGSDWFDLLQKLNKIRMANTGNPLPAQRLDPEEDLDSLLQESFTEKYRDYPSEDETEREPITDARLRSLTSPSYESTYRAGPSTKVRPAQKNTTGLHNGTYFTTDESAPGSKKKIHIGEWRGEDRLQWCSIISKQDGEICIHGTENIMAPHWSCCGGLTEETPPCMVQESANIGDETGIVLDDRGRYDRSSGRGLSMKGRTPGEHLGSLHEKIHRLAQETLEEQSKDNPGGGGYHVHFHLGDKGQRELFGTPGYTPGSQFATKVPQPRGARSRFTSYPALNRDITGVKKVPSTVELNDSRSGGSDIAPPHEAHIRAPRVDRYAPGEGTRGVLGDPVPGHPVSPQVLGAAPGVDLLQPFVASWGEAGDVATKNKDNPPAKVNNNTTKPFYFPGSGGVPLQQPDELLAELLQEEPGEAAVYTESNALARRRFVGTSRLPKDTIQRGIEAGWGGENLSKTPHGRDTVEHHAATVRTEGEISLEEALNGVVERSLGDERGSLCEVVLKDGLGKARRRFSVVEWQGLGACVVLKTLDKHAAGPGDHGWMEYMQCSHIRMAGFASPEKSSLLLSTGPQSWHIHMTSTSAERWLNVVYNVCHWLRPGADSVLHAAPGFGTLPPGAATPTSRTIPRGPVSPRFSKPQTVLQTSPGIHTTIRVDTSKPAPTPNLDKYKKKRGTTTF